MMVGALVRWAMMVGIVACAWPASACIPRPEAQRKHDLSIIELPAPASGVGVVFRSENFAIRVLAADLLPLLAPDHMSIISKNDLAKLVRAKAALGADFSTGDLANELTADSQQQRWAAMRTQQRLSYAYATLLQQGKASVTDLISNRQLPRVQLDSYIETCSLGRTFTTPEGQTVVLRVVDAIS